MKHQVEFWNYILNGNKCEDSESWFSKNQLSNNSISLRFVNNRDGSPRWVFPTTLSNPDFLKFYPIVSWRSLLIHTLFKVLFYTRLMNLVSKKIKIVYSDAPHFFSWFPDATKEFALFAGTVGPNQKIVTFSREKEGNTLFSKISYGKSSGKLLKNEAEVLTFLAHEKFKNFKYPQLIARNNNQLQINELKIGENTNRLTPVHIRAIQELYDADVYQSTYAMGALKNYMFQVMNSTPKIDECIKLKSALKEAFKTALSSDKTIKVGFGHGDFTPWNCGINENHLTIIDWELADEYPLMYDVFHFIIQDELMNTQNNSEAILKKLNATMNSASWIEFCSTNKIEWKEQFAAYLLCVSSYYYTVYDKQEEIHVQAFRAMDIWSQLLDQIPMLVSEVQMRKVFISKLFTRLCNDQYALMKNNGNSIEQHGESSDLDLFISKKSTKEVINWINSQPEVAKQYLHKKSYMKIASIYFTDGSFLSIDFIFQLKRRALEYLSIDSVIQSTRIIDGVKIPQLHHDLQYIILFYGLNKAPIPQKYHAYVERMSATRKNQVLGYLNYEMGFSANELNYFFEVDHDMITEKLSNYIVKKSENKGLSLLKNNLLYTLDTARRLVRGNGFVISFSGVDGAGKSTIINHVKENLEQRFRKKVIILRHRPSILPILSAYIYGKEKAEKRAADTLPRQGNNSSIISSLFRFTYYLTDFLIGQFVVWFKYTLRGHVVLYDRYYFDFIEDPKRSNIRLPRWFRKVFYKFIYKPSINVFLHASPDLILSRKQELSLGEIQQLTSSYKNLFQEFDKKYDEQYVAIENDELNHTLNQIESLIISAA